MKHTLILSIFLFTILVENKAQEVNVTRMADMPEAISNNAVIHGWANDTGYVFSFSGKRNRPIFK